MSRHEGVSCDCCLKNNFRGRRYKCLRCYDFDLCSTCYESGAVNTRHSTDHPMQCILTRADYELFYGGEILPSGEEPQSITCPYCGQTGFTETLLQEHVTAQHADTSYDVICPICAATPGGEPNCTTDDFAGHLALEHRSLSLMDEPVTRHSMRRMPHSGHLTGGRGATSSRGRRSNMQFRYFADYINAPFGVSLTDSTVSGDRLSRVFSSGSSLSPSARDNMQSNDPISDLLSQLSGVRRSTSNTTNTPSQLQQLQSQLQFERQQPSRPATSDRIRRQTQTQRDIGCSTSPSAAALFVNSTQTNSPTETAVSNNFLLNGVLGELSVQVADQRLREERREFMRQLLLSTLERGESRAEVSTRLAEITRALSQLSAHENESAS